MGPRRRGRGKGRGPLWRGRRPSLGGRFNGATARGPWKDDVVGATFDGTALELQWGHGLQGPWKDGTRAGPVP